MDSQLEFIRGLRAELKQAGLNPRDYLFRKLNECVRAYVKRPPGSLGRNGEGRPHPARAESF
jgi:hypothetical protein